MQSLPKISVILPIYNAEKYIAEAIESILHQTYTDFELIAINDGSTDNSLSILQHYQNSDSRIRIFSHANTGLINTLNEGIDLAHGEWIARMDADDIALSQRFERQLFYLEQTGADICGSWIKLFGTKDSRVLRHPQSDSAIKMALLFGSAFAHPTVMMKTALAKKLYYDCEWENVEDYDLWVRATQNHSVMVNVPEVLLWYRQHTAQISNKAFIQQQIKTQEIRRRYWEFLAESIKIEPEWIDEIIKTREQHIFNLNIDYIDYAFTKLLQELDGEAQQVVFDHITRLYFRLAANYPNVVNRWSELHKKFGRGFSIGTKLKLFLLSFFQIGPNSLWFNRIKTFYFYCISFIEKLS
ncbi:glycosyltransferase [Methylomonas sp. AM2-LC]|uniref:glycosyltransferase family 2 protein n=1 Tax=Methylomonas sp. AM2-LC TaxID=3153301 RepID=UPI0032647884